MKKTTRMFTRILFIALAMVVSWGATGQIAPKTTEIDVDGIKMIARESVKGTVSMRTFIRGGVNNYSVQYQGVEELMLSMIA